MLGITPTAFRAGGANTKIRFAIGACSLGAILVARSEGGVCAVLMGDDPDALVRDLKGCFPRARLIGGDADFEALVAKIVGFVEAPRLGLDLPLDVRGTAFQRRVWQALREIPAGSRASYAAIAKRIGAPKSALAVGQACAANTIAAAIPCHRAVRNDGALGATAGASNASARCSSGRPQPEHPNETQADRCGQVSRWPRADSPTLHSSRPCQAAPRVPSRRMIPEPTSAFPSSPARLAAPPRAPKISVVSLGCPKALVDSERIVGQLRAEGYELAKSHRDASAVIVNTCGFLDSAKAESLAAIGQASAENGSVIVTGCMGAEPEAILEKFPKLRWISGPQDFTSVMRAVHEAVAPPHDPFLDLLPPQGIKLTPRHYAYVKISEGCNNRCTFCIIPKLRGVLVSRAAGDVLREAEKLVAAGVKELLVISQDTSAYGLDLNYRTSTFSGRPVKARFFDLARELGQFGVWVRLHYVYPYPHVGEVIELMAEGKILPYLDIPFQHASPKILRAMRRPGGAGKMLERISQWRAVCPDLTLRSTFIVGFPGESEEDFELLLEWLQDAKIDRAGAFKYEPVAGAPANDLGLPPVAPQVAEIRYKRFMELCQKISAGKLKEKIGKRLAVIVDEGGPRAAEGRTKGDAPGIDGKVHIVSRRPLRQGDIVTVKIARSDAYDLHGTAI